LRREGRGGPAALRRETSRAASRAGLEAGDVIESIDGRRTGDPSLDDVPGMLEKPVTRTIAIRGGSRARTVSLTPEPLAWHRRTLATG